jgi:eukaryotic-like serine/threonine-protein kinase
MSDEAEGVLLALALEKPPDLRPAFLDAVCGGNAPLRARLEALLAKKLQTHSVPPAKGEHRVSPAPGEAAGAAEALERDATGQTVGPYKLLEKLGEGGCGVVYVAEQTEPVRRRVALKVIKLGMDTKDFVARFEAERQALAMMDHPNIARVLDAGATEMGRPYFVMELVRGIKITDYCDQGNLSTKDRLDLFIKVCHAIQHAHQKGIIHRDIKPSNILVTLHDGVPVPKVIDFGIAKATEGRLTDATVYTQLHQFIGTPAYMSPEQAEMSGLDIDTRSDIYSLGVLLYELLTGRTPFDPAELLAAGLDLLRKTIREKEPQRPSTKLASLKVDELTTTARRRSSDTARLIHLLRGDLDWIVMKCLEKDRTRRYETANGLAADLKRHLSDEPVVARPPSAVYRLRKTVRRNKLVFASGAAVAAALLVALVFSSWSLVREQDARFAEQVQRQEAERQRQAAEAARRVAEVEKGRADVQARQATESHQRSRRLLYAADMSLAQQSLALNNLGKARRLLDRHRPQPGEEDLRGWEWRYLWQETRSGALATLTRRPETRCISLAFSPDGTRLAVGWFDGRVDLWDVPARRLIRALVDRSRGLSGRVALTGRVAFSPLRSLLAATSEPKVVALHDLDSGEESVLWRLSDPGDWGLRDLTFSPDGSRVIIYAGPADAAPGPGEAAWVVDVATARTLSRHPASVLGSSHHGASRISSDNRRLYLARSDPKNYRYRIQCLDLDSGQEIWQTEALRDFGLTSLAVSPDGKVLASASGFDDPAIRIWDATAGRLLFRLDGHTAWVCQVLFSSDGRQLISAGSDQSIRFWDTGTWTESTVLRGHSDEVHAVALSERAHLLASGSKDGDLMLWNVGGKGAGDPAGRLRDLGDGQLLALDRSRFLRLPAAGPPEILDLQRDALPVRLAGFASSADVLDCAGEGFLCCWDGSSRILVRELRGEELRERGEVRLDGRTRPTGAAYDPARRRVAWSEGPSSASVHLASLDAPARRVELKSEVPGLVPLRFSADGTRLVAGLEQPDPQSPRNMSLRALHVWEVESGRLLIALDEPAIPPVFAAGGQVLAVTIQHAYEHEVVFYDLLHPERAPRRVRGRDYSPALAVSPDGKLVASSTRGGLVRLFDPATGELIDSVHGHLNGAHGLAFSPDGRRLISLSVGREAIKLWDVETRQELLTLPGGGFGFGGDLARWSADGDVILSGDPWRAWRAPSWEEIAAAEAKEKAEGRQP